MDFTLSKGAKGDTGLTGPMGPQGTAGPANILRIGLVTTGKTANAIISGTAPSQTLSFILPEAVTTSLSIGTVNMGDAPAATITGSPPNQVLNLTFPKYRPEPALSFSSDGPLPVTAAVGTAWEMFSSATSTEFPIVYQWQYTDTPEVEESWKDIAGQGSESLRRIASVDNGGRWYRNTATTASNKTTSRMAQLTVFSDPSNPDGNRQEWFNQPVPSQGYPLFGRVRPFTTTADGVYLQLNDGVLIRDDRVRQLDALPIKQANNRLFMSSCYSDDGTTWVPFIKGPMDFLEGGSGPAAVVSDVAYANGVYHMWLTNRRNGTGEDAFWLYQQRFVSSDCKVWSIIPNDRWPSTGTWRQLANGQIEFGGDVSQGLWPQWQKSSLDWKTRSATPLPFPPQTICEVLLWEKVNNVEAICYAYIANKTKTRIGLCQLPDDIVLCGLSYGYVPAYDKYCYVGLASNNKIYVCPDPATSTTYDAYDIPPGPFFTQPAYAKKCWLATAVSPSSIYFTSEDLKTWTAHQQPFAFPDDYCGRVISFKDRFIYLSVYTSSISPGLVEGMQSSITIFHSL
jgi:hypothetical protein